MSRHGDVTFPWGDGNGPGEDGSYTFRVGIAEIRKLQERCDAGPFELLRRFTTGAWRIDDLRETIRYGLIGGGSVKAETGATDDRRVNRLLAEYVDGRPFLFSVAAAVRILDAALSGASDEQIPKSAAAERVAPSFQMESSPSPPSTDGDQASAIHQPKSIRSLSGSSTPAKSDSALPKAVRKNSRRQPQTNSTQSQVS